jgi:hypothetical protein
VSQGHRDDGPHGRQWPISSLPEEVSAQPTVPGPRAPGDDRPQDGGSPWSAPPQWGPVPRPPQPPAWPPRPIAPQQWGPPPPPGPPRRTNTALWVALGAVLVLVLAGGGVGFWLWQRSNSQTATQAVATVTQQLQGTTGSGGTGGAFGGASQVPARTSVPQASVPPSPGTPVPGLGNVTEQQAVAYLGQLRAQSLQRVVLDGRWVAQVASKNVGVTDPLQTALNGSHTFYAVDILAESLSMNRTVDTPNKVYVLWGTDFGQRSQAADGSPFWTTVVDAGYASHDNVLEWCSFAFPTLTPAQLADTCVPRQLAPPHN